MYTDALDQSDDVATLQKGACDLLGLSIVDVDPSVQRLHRLPGLERVDDAVYFTFHFGSCHAVGDERGEIVVRSEVPVVLDYFKIVLPYLRVGRVSQTDIGLFEP
jgi:hypothetical protein